MKNKHLNKEIDSLRDIRNHFWQALLLSIGGNIAIIFNFAGILSLFFLVLGIITTAISLLGYFNHNDRINLLIKKIEGD